MHILIVKALKHLFRLYESLMLCRQGQGNAEDRISVSTLESYGVSTSSVRGNARY